MSSIILSVFLFLVLVVVGMFFLRGRSSRKGRAPGLVDGKLAKCSKKPNGVCSEFPSDKSHYVEPINVDQVNMGQHFHKVAQAIIATGGKITSEKDNYISATYTSLVFRFVDDVEARLDKSAGLIHLRSASREGYSDLGVNAKRIAAIKKAYGE